MVALPALAELYCSYAGTPEWNTETGGNHDWVEVWDSGVWSYTGAAEYMPEGFNRTWFVPEPAKHAIPGSRQHAIYAVSWHAIAQTVQYPLMWDDAHNRSVNAYDVSDYYLQASSVHPGHQAAQSAVSIYKYTATISLNIYLTQPVQEAS